MPAPLDEPIYKLLINLYYQDAVEMERIYGRGWSGKIRDLVRQHLKERKQWETPSTS